MRLSAKILQNVETVNNWQYANEAYIYESQANEFYFQIVDLGKNTMINNCIGVVPEYPLRYISQATVASVLVGFNSVDDDSVLSIAATQPFADDKSIWKVSLTSSQTPKTGAIQITLTEDGVSKIFTVKAAISTQLNEIGSC